MFAHVLCLLVPAAILLMALRPQCRRVAAVLRRIGPVRGAVAVVAAGCIVAAGGSKGPGPAKMPLAQLLTVLATGGLPGPYAHNVASGVAAAAIQASIVASSNIVYQTMQVLEDAEAEIEALEEDAETLPDAMWLAVDLVPPSVDPRNLYAQIEGSDKVSDSRIRYYVSFSFEPALAPVMEFEVSVLPDVWQTMTALTNSFPDYVERQRSDGSPVDCLWYEVDVPAPAVGLSLRPEISAGLGAPDAPLTSPPLTLTVDNVLQTLGEGWFTTGLGFDLLAYDGVAVDWRITP